MIRVLEYKYKEVIKIATKGTEYSKVWQNKNKDYANYLKDRSKSRSFIKNKATKDDLEEFKDLISTREETLILNDTDHEEK